MVVDTSAIVADLTGEPDGDVFDRAMRGAPRLVMSAVTNYECRVVLCSRARDPAGMLKQLEDFAAELSITVLPFTAADAALAFEAYRRYGKGWGHPAKLNLCDCAAYALAKSLDLPLLFKGNDFAQTDIRPALSP